MVSISQRYSHVQNTQLYAIATAECDSAVTLTAQIFEWHRGDWHVFSDNLWLLFKGMIGKKYMGNIILQELKDCIIHVF